ncbi:NAD(P)/FAD-dependent oxidoreductase [Mycobacterium sp.]|uniref:phytoene desaturase family protein n=1 Tax=Mycobacterium sp. TaxID=1785 RepID=UPI002CD4F452|nr:NAD(P)/FAD-dependent oxidoreductase [Mycobacterium sp.]HTQ17306.1 NAD(P)/FAD-dependent oxidoreductase [Mycobacterium sp.]
MTRAVVVGSGPNGLAAALTLATEGVDVVVVEAAATPGGGTRSSELTVPGLIHDECSGFHPLAVDTAFSKAFDLAAYGLTWCRPQVQYAHPLDGGTGAASYQSVEVTARGLGGDGERWRSVFEPLASNFDKITSDFLQPMLRVPSHPVALLRFGVLSAMPATLLARRWSSDEARALFGGVAAHAMHDLSSPMSSAIGVALATAAHAYGWPVAQGGSAAISTAMVAALEGRGGKVLTGVTVRDLDELESPDLVMLDVAPRAAVEIVGERMPTRIRRALTRYQHGPAVFKVDYAIDGDVPWQHEASRLAGTVHAIGGFREIVAAERQVSAGRLPERPFVLVGQQYLADPARSSGGLNPLYAYAHVPAGFRGDAAVAIEAQIERFAPGFRDRIVARHVRSTAQMQSYNPNYVGGDVVTGANTARQIVFRPRFALNPYAVGVPGVYLCSAATPPGAGAHGMCGYNAAKAALSTLS